MSEVSLSILNIEINPDKMTLNKETDNSVVFAHYLHWSDRIIRPVQLFTLPVSRLFDNKSETIDVLGVQPGDVVITNKHNDGNAHLGVSIFPFKYWIRASQHGFRTVIRANPSVVASLVHTWNVDPDCFPTYSNGELAIESVKVFKPSDLVAHSEAFLLNEMVACQYQDFSEFMGSITKRVETTRNELTHDMFPQVYPPT
jgi:hypothetical protein